MKFEWFHLMPYQDLPADFPEKYHSVWVDVPAELYDPVRGHAMYHEYLDEFLVADRLGFDGVCVNEHHQNAYGLMPSPNLMASILSRITTHAKIVVMGNSVALYNPPTRVAEEMAMLDVLSGGRLVAGFPVGTSQDSIFTYGVPPAILRDKYYEGVRLILRAWEEKEPFAFDGRYTKLRYVNVWPRPLQSPRPPVWIPGGGSVETWKWCIENDFLYAFLSYFGKDAGLRTMRGFWDTVEQLGAEPNPYRAGFLQFVAIADSDAEAERLYAEPALYFYKRCFHIPAGFAAPPGYLSEESLRRAFESRLIQATQEIHDDLTWKDVVDRGYVIAGSPDTVVQRLTDVADTLHVGHLMLLLHFGNMSREVATHNTERFATEVMPKLRDHFGDWEDRWWPRDTVPRLANAESER
ncbi:MAG: LLM class flavin-dependent oxidoreductase [Acidimicrobiales bacterium]|nr:LLM class flavin-dependent oxidoreductase [Acidimicrobiales bacterium]